MIFLRAISVFAITCISISAPAAAASGWKRIYVFGDSYSDSGAGYIDGNGPTWAFYLGEKLHIRLVPNGAPDARSGSINFAVSGGGSGEAEGITFSAREPSDPAKKVTMARGVLTQAKEFQSRVNSGEVSFDTATTIFFIEAGLNDSRLPTETAVANIENAIKIVSGVGGRNFLVTMLPEKIPPFSNTARRINAGLANIPQDMTTALPGVMVMLSNWGRYYDEILTTPKKFAFTNWTDKCAGRRIMNQDATPCATPDRYFFYTEGHPSTAAHKLVGQRMVQDVKLALKARRKLNRSQR